MDTRLPFPVEIVFLLLVLPIVFAYLFSVAGVALIFARTALRNLASRLRSPRSRTPSPHA